MEWDPSDWRGRLTRPERARKAAHECVSDYGPAMIGKERTRLDSPWRGISWGQAALERILALVRLAHQLGRDIGRLGCRLRRSERLLALLRLLLFLVGSLLAIGHGVLHSMARDRTIADSRGRKNSSKLRDDKGISEPIARSCRNRVPYRPRGAKVGARGAAAAFASHAATLTPRMSSHSPGRMPLGSKANSRYGEVN